MRSLNDRQLIQFNRLAELERLHAQLDGERGELITELARTEARATETRLQILQVDRDRRAEVATELRDVDNKLAELAEQQIASQDALRRIDIRSPQPGIVHELAVHTVGGVVAPGETLMQIVPVNDVLVVETRLHPADIDQLHVGQKATLRFSAFNQRMTSESFGEVKTISADLAGNPQTGEVCHTAACKSRRKNFQGVETCLFLPACPWRHSSRPAREPRFPISSNRFTTKSQRPCVKNN